MAGGETSYHTQDKTEAFLPEKGRLMSLVPGMRLEVQEGQELCPVLRTNIPASSMPQQ